MKKILIKSFVGMIVFALLLFLILSYHKIALKTAYDEGVFFGYAEGYLKHKYYPESNEFFVYDKKLFDYLSVQTNVYITQDKVYHRKWCAEYSDAVKIVDIFTEYSPCPSCKPPVILQ